MSRCRHARCKSIWIGVAGKLIHRGSRSAAICCVRSAISSRRYCCELEVQSFDRFELGARDDLQDGRSNNGGTITAEWRCHGHDRAAVSLMVSESRRESGPERLRSDVLDERQPLLRRGFAAMPSRARRLAGLWLRCDRWPLRKRLIVVGDVRQIKAIWLTVGSTKTASPSRSSAASQARARGERLFLARKMPLIVWG